MESNGHPMEAGWHPKQPNGAKSMSNGIEIAPERAPKASKIELKVDQNHPNRANRAATATKMEAKVRQWSL